ncbi:MAG: hypothetical protein ABI687_10840, partial [Flavitalea sp.]
SYLQQVTAPVSIFQGTNDWIIRPGNAEKLKPFLKKHDEFIWIKNGEHNNLPGFELFNQKIDSLLK